MNRVLEVCLVGLTLLASAVAANDAAAQTLRKGVSVEMAVTKSAAPMPEADDENAWIVTIRRDEALYFGTDMATASGLEEAMKRRPRNRWQKLYVKADARAPFADVEGVLEAARRVGFEAPVLLTAQTESPAPGTIVPPRGLEVLVVPPAGAQAIVVQVSAGEPSPGLKVNNEAISPDALESRLKQLLQNSSEKVVLVKADGRVPFAQVVRVIDACRSTGAKAVLATPEP